MANPANVVAPWQRGNVRIWASATIGGTPSGAAEMSFKNVGFIFPISIRSLDEYDHWADGLPLKQDNGFSLGIERSTFTIQLPFQLNALALLLSSVTQTYSFVTGAVTNLPYTASVAAKFFIMEVGWAANNAVSRAIGCVAKAVRINFPAMGADGGRPTIEADCICQTVTGLSAFTGAGTADITAPTFTYNLRITDLALNQDKFIAADLTIENNADWSPNASAVADAIFLGQMKISGNLSFAFATESGDEWITFRSLYTGKTKLDSVWVPTTNSTWKIPFLVKTPAMETAGNVATVKFPFEGVYKDADEPSWVTGTVTDLLTAW